jgi:hypothetical protein
VCDALDKFYLLPKIFNVQKSLLLFEISVPHGSEVVMLVFWDVIPRGLTNIYQRLKIEIVCPSKTLVSTHKYKHLSL